MHSTWLAQPNPDIDDHWFQLQKLWLGMSYHKEWAEFNFMQTINLFDQAQSRYGIPVIQFNCLPNPYSPQVPTLVYPGLNFRDILLEKQRSLNVNAFAPKGHPNEKGHQLVADHLIEHIKYSKILG
jgi:lysophospholipase L1-like esterase